MSRIWQDLKLRTDTKKTLFHDEIERGAQNIDTILGSIVNIIGRAYVIGQRERESAL